jgi:hypothetical protein
VDGHTNAVETHEYRFGFDPSNRETTKIGNPMLGVGITHGLDAVNAESGVLQRGDLKTRPVCFLGEDSRLTEGTCCNAHADDAENVLEPSSARPLLGASSQEGCQHVTFSDKECGNPLGSSQKFTGHTDDVCIKITEVHIDMAEYH